MIEGEEVRLRQLPAGGFRHGFHRGLQGNLLEVEFASAEQVEGIQSGWLVEVESERTIYLGELQTRQGMKAVIRVEHTVDRPALAAIQDVWDYPDRH